MPSFKLVSIPDCRCIERTAPDESLGDALRARLVEIRLGIKQRRLEVETSSAAGVTKNGKARKGQWYAIRVPDDELKLLLQDPSIKDPLRRTLRKSLYGI